MDATLEKALERTLLEITSIASPIGEEKNLCDAIEQRLSRSLGTEAIVRTGHSLVVRVSSRSGAPKIALVGHLDTVRTEHDGAVRVEKGRLYGAGAADMKSGLAVMIELAERVDASTLPCELFLVFYEREEGPFEENSLGPILEKHDELRSLDLAVCLEPSDNKLQLGCLGSLHASVVFKGRTAHSARPWQGDNALIKAAPFLVELGARGRKEVVLEGLTYYEVITPTLASGGRGRNVVPDRFELNINYRFGPGRSTDAALEDVRALAGDRAEVVLKDAAPGGQPRKSHPLIGHLATCGVQATEPKQAWTDVARFDAIDVPAVNFGPGTQAQAHQRNEYTELALLPEGYRILERFVSTIPVRSAK